MEYFARNHFFLHLVFNILRDTRGRGVPYFTSFGFRTGKSQRTSDSLPSNKRRAAAAQNPGHSVQDSPQFAFCSLLSINCMYNAASVLMRFSTSGSTERADFARAGVIDRNAHPATATASLPGLHDTRRFCERWGGLIYRNSYRTARPETYRAGTEQARSGTYGR